MTFQTQYQSPIGWLTMVSDGSSLIGLWMEHQKNPEAGRQIASAQAGDLPLFHQVKCWLDQSFVGEEPAVTDIPIAPQGTAFQQEVWSLLRRIPYGSTRTYGDLAAEIAVRRHQNTMSAQAVGNAIGKNPISILVPCHRVIGANGSLTGYDGGIDRKQWLLRHEGILR